jgi:hypothetical protein
MPKPRKTRDVWDVRGNYGQGFEVVYSSEDRADARARLKEYDENEPTIPHHIVKTREPIRIIAR